MPRYILFLRGGEFNQYSPQEMGEISARYRQWLRERQREGRNASGAPLYDETKTLAGGKAVDGPFAETKEVIGGFYILDADEQEIVALASTCPHPDYGGSIEIRRLGEVSVVDC